MIKCLPIVGWTARAFVYFRGVLIMGSRVSMRKPQSYSGIWRDVLQLIDGTALSCICRRRLCLHRLRATWIQGFCQCYLTYRFISG